jgi:hypothetical protein
MAALGVRFVAGDLSESDYIAAARSRQHPARERAGAGLFTSLEELGPQGRLAIGHDPRRYWEKQ